MRFNNISINVSIISTCELKTYATIKEDANTVKPRAHPRFTMSLLEIFTHLWKLFQGKNFLKECFVMLLVQFSDCFIATSEFQIFSAKKVMMVKLFRNVAKS